MLWVALFFAFTSGLMACMSAVNWAEGEPWRSDAFISAWYLVLALAFAGVGV
jgi:hypothetical protein